MELLELGKKFAAVIYKWEHCPLSDQNCCGRYFLRPEKHVALAFLQKHVPKFAAAQSTRSLLQHGVLSMLHALLFLLADIKTACLDQYLSDLNAFIFIYGGSMLHALQFLLADVKTAPWTGPTGTAPVNTYCQNGSIVSHKP
jgi:hypothetical protein